MGGTLRSGTTTVPGMDDKDLVWGFVQKYAPGVSPETHPELDGLIENAVNYGRDFIAPTLKRRAPDERKPSLRVVHSQLFGEMLLQEAPHADGEVLSEVASMRLVIQPADHRSEDRSIRAHTLAHPVNGTRGRCGKPHKGIVALAHHEEFL